MAKKEISLLPKDHFGGGVLGKFFKWVLSVGRYIVVFTELIVIGAFASRFWLDRKNSDLSEKIRQQTTILESVQSFEKDFRLFQAKLGVIDRSLDNDVSYSAPLDLVAESLTSGMDLLRYSFSKGESNDSTLKGNISILTSVYTEASLANFIENLVYSDRVDSVTVGTIEQERGTAGMKIQFIIGYHGSKKNG